MQTQRQLIPFCQTFAHFWCFIPGHADAKFRDANCPAWELSDRLALCPDTAPALSGLGTSVLKNESSAEVPVGREQLALFGVWSCGEPWCCPSYIPTIL